MIQKAVSAGCQQSPWVRIRPEYVKPRLKLEMPSGTLVRIDLHREGCEPEPFTCEDTLMFNLPLDITFVRLYVVKGNPELVLCLLQADDAVQAA
jgi:hypothetical protein